MSIKEVRVAPLTRVDLAPSRGRKFLLADVRHSKPAEYLKNVRRRFDFAWYVFRILSDLNYNIRYGLKENMVKMQ